MIKLWRIGTNPDGSGLDIYQAAVDPDWVGMCYDTEPLPSLELLPKRKALGLPATCFVIRTRDGNSLLCVGATEGFFDAVNTGAYGEPATEYPERN